MTDTTQPIYVTVFYAVIVLFAIVGLFSTLGFLQHLNQQQLLANEQTITTDVTVSSMSCSDTRCYSVGGFVDTNGRGYITNTIYSFSHMDNIVVGHTYTIKYFCNIIDNNDSTVMEMVDHENNPYTCVEENGVCR